MSLLQILLSCLLVNAVTCEYKQYNTTSSRRPDKLNVHIICHSHDDPGWLKTVDQYFIGSNQHIQVAGVRSILDSVMRELLDNPDRRFSYGEMAYFTRWWSEQSPAQQDTVKQLVREGRLHFVNGGWVQHDEACTDYTAMLDQTTKGHRFLKATFNTTPSTAWQVDPFGHSASAASLAALMGFESFMFGRSDYEDEDARKRTREMEMVWRASTSLSPPQGDVFTVHFAQGNHSGLSYGWLPGFNWEWGLGGDDPIQDRCDLHDYNVHQRVEEFVQHALRLFSLTRGNDIMILFGSDFTYANAMSWYKNIDKLIHYTNADGRIHTFYSTPDMYTAAKASYNVSWPAKYASDFYPYADRKHCYWAGFYSSRPTHKFAIRQATSYLHAARQLQVLQTPQTPQTLQIPDIPPSIYHHHHGLHTTSGNPVHTTQSDNPLDALESAVSLTQHHDAITGTEKQHVANDYSMRVHAGLTIAEHMVNTILSTHIAITYNTTTPPHLEHCRLSNASICRSSVIATRFCMPVYIAVYNPLAHTRVHTPLMLPVAVGGCNYTLLDEHHTPINTQLLPLSPTTYSIQHTYLDIGAVVDPMSLGDHTLAAVFPPLTPWSVHSFVLMPTHGGGGNGVHSTHDGGVHNGGVHVTQDNDSTHDTHNAHDDDGDTHTSHHDAGVALYAWQRMLCRAMHHVTWWLHEAMRWLHDAYQWTVQTRATAHTPPPAAPVVVSNGNVTLVFSTTTGALTSMTVDNIHVDLRVDLLWYTPSDGNESEIQGQAGGAYVLRLKGDANVPQGPLGVPRLRVVEGEVVTEVHQQWNAWGSLVYRVWKHAASVQVEWTIGPLPLDAGREVVVRYSSSVDSGDVFYTDSNGREVLRRQRRVLEGAAPVADNYYPITSGIHIQQPGVAALTVSVDRACGASSLSTGSIEVLVHRKTLHDDFRGVGEPMNETECGCTSCDCVGLTARGTHTLTLTHTSPWGALLRRQHQLYIHNPPVVAVGGVEGEVDGNDGVKREGMMLKKQGDMMMKGEGMVKQAQQRSNMMQEHGHALPPFIHVPTMQLLEHDTLLVRIAHMLQVEEVDNTTMYATLDLHCLLSSWVPGTIQSVIETTLTSVTPRSQLHRHVFRAGAPLQATHTHASTPDTLDAPPNPLLSNEKEAQRMVVLECTSAQACGAPGALSVTLGPMDIRAFVITF